MDKVKVSVEALQSAEKTLREMEERIGTIVFQHESKIKDNFDGIDENLQKGLVEHIEALKKLRALVSAFEETNKKAIHDRISRISEYSNTSYRKRNLM